MQEPPQPSPPDRVPTESSGPSTAEDAAAGAEIAADLDAIEAELSALDAPPEGQLL